MVDNIAALSLEPYPPPYGWLSPRVSFSRDLLPEAPPPPMAPLPPPADGPDPVAASGMDFIDFEFPLDYPVTMLPADELFSDGKLVPLQLTAAKPPAEAAAEELAVAEIRSPESTKIRRMVADVSRSDPYLFSPRAPSCTSRWREILGLKRAQGSRQDAQKAVADAAASSARNPYRKSLKNLLHRNPKTAASIDGSVSLPLLRDSDSETVSISSSRLSLSSSSSSGPDHEDLPRLSLDSEKPNQSQNLISLGRHSPLRVRLVRPRPNTNPPTSRAGRSPARRAVEVPPPPRGASVDSPRMNSSGKVVFHGLERSSSSPGNFIAGPRPRPRGMERSYSSNVRVTPVLNVPVCSLRGSGKSVSVFGLGQLFSAQKKDKDGPAQTGFSSSARSGSSRTKVDRQVKPLSKDINY